GVDRISLIGSPFTGLVAPDSQDHFYFHKNRVCDEGGRQKSEIKMRRQDGSEFYAMLESVAVEGSMQCRTTLSDITERRAAEDERNRAKEELEKRTEEVTAERRRLYNVLEELPAMICLLTADYHVAFANRAFRDRFGEAEGRHCYDYCYGLSEPCAFCEAYKVFETGLPHRWEVSGPNGSVLEAYDIPFFDTDGSPMVLEMDLDITERRRAEQELHRYREHLEELVEQRTRELRELAHRLVRAQEQERARIGSELHDEIGQLLTYTTLLIDRAMRKPEPPLLAQAKSTIQEAISGIRNLSSMLSPSLLRSAGLVRALFSLTEEYARRTNIPVEFNHDNRLEEKVPEDVALAGYRIAQEALTNVARHAGASEVKMQLSCEAGWLRLEVADNGSGFDPGAVRSSTGLTGMRERALALGGRLSLDSCTGRGTRIIAEIPLRGMASS
ncbi:MAG: PAS domain-containing protein, partial [Dehalococcoidia bacterium]|nr:PAS domain-containing protein [Dehalococcoidia bacterium]